MLQQRARRADTYNSAMRLFCTLLSLMLLAACGGEAERNDVTELIKQDAQVGTGAEAVAGRDVTVHYTGWLYDPSRPDHKGTKFDSSRDRNEPFGFRLGAGQVIPGWDQGVAGMKVGGQRTLTIPSDMGYGARGAGGVIPPDATLLFDVELLDVK
jgi:FKBP-type peptidyl-prolyl cis-trans isomerase FkpA